MNLPEIGRVKLGTFALDLRSGELWELDEPAGGRKIAKKPVPGIDACRTHGGKKQHGHTIHNSIALLEATAWAIESPEVSD